MIFVTTGISGAPFDRLLRVIDELSVDEEIVVQHGPSVVRPRNARCVSFLPFDELSRLVADASHVITHAGAGSVLVAFVNGKRPIVVPRLPHHGELVDDHQLRFARHLGAAGLADVVEDPAELPAYIRTAPVAERTPPPTKTRLMSDLSTYVDSILATEDADRRSAVAGESMEAYR